MKLFHGGIRGLNIGDELVPSPPVIVDDCPICIARSQGRTVTVGEYRDFLLPLGARARPVLAMLEGAPGNMPVDPPSQQLAVYLTSCREYARWYAARSEGDLYCAVPLGDCEASTEDPFPTWTTPRAQIVEVIERRVHLRRKDRRALFHAWGKADRAHNAGT